MRYLLFTPAILALAACGAERSPEEQRIADEADIAAVEAAQEAIPEPISLQPIRYPDIERNKLFGMGCSFAPDGGGLGAVALAQPKAGYLKVDGTIVRLAADIGSKEQAYGARTQYDGTAFSFDFVLNEESGVQSGMETNKYKAQLVVRDSSDLVVYKADGIAQCGV